MNNTKVIWIISLSLILGLGLNALIMGRGFERFRKEDRYISVKGFSEREVKSDLAVWAIQCRVSNDDIQLGSQEIEAVKNKIVSFLKKNGIQDHEIIQKEVIVHDKKSQDYGNFNEALSYRFNIDKMLQVRSSNVENVQRVSRMTDQLLKMGVWLNNQNSYEGPVRYYYTKLNDIKSSMLVEATKNAKSAAQNFASESEEKLGKLKRASQGYFSIVDRDASLSGSDGGYYLSGELDVYKKIRVVVNVDYSIE